MPIKQLTLLAEELHRQNNKATLKLKNIAYLLLFAVKIVARVGDMDGEKQ